MAREQIEYLFIPNLPRVSRVGAGHPPGLQLGVLSQDHDNGAISYIANVSSQWIRRASGYYESDLELIVLKGNLIIGDTELTQWCYSYLPAGAIQGAVSSEEGCEFLMFFDGLPTFFPASASAPGCRESLRVDHLNTQSMEWQLPPSVPGRLSGEAPSGLYVKILRQDPETTAFTAFTRHDPNWFDLKLESHDTSEELILFEGDFLMGTTGVVMGGTYIFREGLIPHGPQASKHGASWLSRGNRQINFDYQSEVWAEEMAKNYIKRTDISANPHDRAPWGAWLS